MISFLGTCQFYAKFIPNYASICVPMTDLLKKESLEPLVWSKIAAESFEKLKSMLCKSPILHLPNKEKMFVVRSDASSVGVGALLLQYDNEIPHPIAYASRKLLPRECNCSKIERELLAVVFAINKFRFYLISNKFVLEVDHRPLVFLSKFKRDNPRLMRWALSLQAYDFRIVYLPGKENIGADMLSRP